MKSVNLKSCGKVLTVAFASMFVLIACSKKDVDDAAFTYVIESINREKQDVNVGMGENGEVGKVTWVPYVDSGTPGQFTVHYMRESSCSSTFFSKSEADVLQLFIVDAEGQNDSDCYGSFAYSIECKHTGEIFKGLKLHVYEEKEGVFQLASEYTLDW